MNILVLLPYKPSQLSMMKLWTRIILNESFLATLVLHYVLTLVPSYRPAGEFRLVDTFLLGDELRC